MAKQRLPGIDLLRCLAFFLACGIHFFMFNGFYDEPQQGIAMLLCNSFRWLCFGSIGLFIMLTGFLRCETTDIRSCYRGLIPVLLAYLLATAVSIPVRHYLLGEPHTAVEWLKLFLQFLAVRYGWYVKMYIGLALLMPFINLLLAQLKSRASLLTLAAVMIVVTALPGTTPYTVAPNFWRECYPLTFYILGAVIRRLDLRLRPWQGLGAAALLALLCGCLTVFSGSGTLDSCSFTFGYGDLWIVAIAVCLFVSLYHLQFPRKMGCILSFCAGGTYCGYLLCNLLDSFLYRQFPQWHQPQRYLLLFLCATVPIFIGSVLLGKALQWITDRLLLTKK